MFDKTVTCSCLFIAGDLCWFHKLNWVLFSVGATTAFQVTGLFWTVLAPSRTAAENLNPITFHLHGTSSILFLDEIFMVAFPTRLLHFVYPIIFSFTYAVFSVNLHFTGVNSSIYPVVNFVENAGLAIGTIAGNVFILTPVLHSVVYLIYRFRTFIFNHTNMRKTTSTSPPEDSETA